MDRNANKIFPTTKHSPAKYHVKSVHPEVEPGSLLEERRSSLEPSMLPRSVLINFATNNKPPVVPEKEPDLPFIITKKQKVKYRIDNKSTESGSGKEHISALRPNLYQLRPSIARDALQEYLLEGYGIKKFSPQAKVKHVRFKRDSEFYFENPASHVAAEDSAIRGVINLLRQNAFPKFFVARQSENRVYLEAMPEKKQSQLELQIQRLPIQRIAKKRDKPAKVVLHQKAKQGQTGAETTILEPARTIEEDKKEGMTKDLRKKSKDDSMVNMRECKKRSVAGIHYSENRPSLKGNSSRNTTQVSPGNTAPETSRKNFLGALKETTKKEESPAAPALPALDEKLPSQFIVPRHHGITATGSPRKKSAEKRPKPKNSPKRKSLSRAGYRKRQKDESPPIVIERLKQKSKPFFLPHDYDYTFTIMYGNNSGIIRSAFDKRLDYWKEVPYFTSTFHFKWQPFSKGIRFDQLSCSQKQMVNHFEFHHEITTKDGLFRNLLGYTQGNKLNVFDYVPLTFTVDLDSESKSPDYDKFILCYNILDSAAKTVEKVEGEEYDKCFKQINAKLQAITFTKERRSSNFIRGKLQETHFAGRNIWILKPTGFNRGRGISVFDSLEKLRSLIKEYSEGVSEDGSPVNTQNPEQPIANSEPAGISNLNNLPCIIRTRSFVIQKYIERPLLIHSRKFDIRCWALVTDDMKLYFFKEGYIRTSSSAYTMDQKAIEKRDVHLTNNAVQKFCEGYGKFEDGNQLSFPMFQKYIDEVEGEGKIDVYKDLVGQMKEHVLISMQAVILIYSKAKVRKKLNAEDRHYCFELFGYDFIIDEKYKVWLIEVNTNPCLEESSAILKMFLPRLIDDMLKLTVDQLFPRKKRDLNIRDKIYKVDGYNDYENMWEFLCQLVTVKQLTNPNPNTGQKPLPFYV